MLIIAIGTCGVLGVAFVAGYLAFATHPTHPVAYDPVKSRRSLLLHRPTGLD